MAAEAARCPHAQPQHGYAANGRAPPRRATAACPCFTTGTERSGLAMAVYVDDMNLRADVPDGGTVVRGRWSHLFADTEDELRAFAAKIGLNQDWIQHAGQPHVHFDVTGRMRQRALTAGATPVTWRQAGEFFAQRDRQALVPARRGTQPGGPAVKRRAATSPQGGGRALRQAAHRYLDDGLLAVPGVGCPADGECCCPRGADCPRPGKHPRSVHAGPGGRGLLVEAAGLPHPR